MKKVNFTSEAPSKGFPMLPKGAYVCGITNVKVDGREPDQQLVLRLDIIEGEYAGYFTKRYQNDSQNSSGKYEVKYKGDFRIQIPDERNAKRQHPEWDQKKLNTSIWCIEQSNPGFHWDGEHEMDLKGKIVGISMQYGTFNGIGYTTIGRLEVADDVRKGAVREMKDRPDRMSDGAAATVDQPTGFSVVEDVEVPF